MAICDLTGAARWNPLWKGNPAVWVPQQPLRLFREPYIVTGGGCLPYIQYPYSAETGWRWTGWRVRDHRPSLYLTREELSLGTTLREQIGPYIVVEPTASVKAPNRRPPSALWQALVNEMRVAFPFHVVQLAHAEADLLAGVVCAPHATFREACGIVAGSLLLVVTEGGLAHAAAALATPAVVLFGGCISVEALGYPEHVNLVDPSSETPCGSLKPCDHCVRAWAALTVDRLIGSIGTALQTGVAHGVS